MHAKYERTPPPMGGAGQERETIPTGLAKEVLPPDLYDRVVQRTTSRRFTCRVRREAASG